MSSSPSHPHHWGQGQRKLLSSGWIDIMKTGGSCIIIYKPQLLFRLKRRCALSQNKALVVGKGGAPHQHQPLWVPGTEGATDGGKHQHPDPVRADQRLLLDIHLPGLELKVNFKK